MIESQQVSPLIAFVAGVASILSPCVLPLLPAVMAYSSETGKLRPIAIVTGLCISFTAMGVVFGAFGDVVWRYREYMEIVAEITIIAFGLVMLFDLPLFDRLSALAPHTQQKQKGLFGGLLFGVSLGIVWMPCIGPILGGILAMAAREGDVLYGGFLLFIYSLGLGIPMLGVAYAASRSTVHIRAISRHTLAIRKIAGGILVLIGLGMILGVYDLFWGWITDIIYTIRYNLI
ncbi:MAG: cytochrome c biogenesis CcdA family protein [Euryarchaeota archaeon]|nr:cytochrome c biogenesis CcdA family protein [Euryarchaeota archaeon]